MAYPQAMLRIRFVVGHSPSLLEKTDKALPRVVDVLAKAFIPESACHTPLTVLILQIDFWVQQQSKAQLRVYAGQAGRSSAAKPNRLPLL